MVGGGLAGLSAATELAGAGFVVNVLEANSHAGGRVRSLHQPFADGMYAEAGAMSFLDIHTAVIKYVQKFNLPMRSIPPASGTNVCVVHGFRVLLAGNRQTAGMRLSPAEQKMGGVDKVQQYYMSKGTQAVGDATAPGWPGPELTYLDKMSCADYFRSIGASEGAIRLLNLSLIGFNGDGIETCSALFLLGTSSLYQKFKTIYAIPGGNDLLPRAMASALDPNVHYGCPVTRVEQTAQGVTAYYTRAGQPESIASDYLVCAIPFSRARTIDFSPPLSDAKRELIGQLPNTSVTRIFLQAEQQFWEAHQLTGDAETDLPIMLVFSAYPWPSRRGILECYTAGENARLLMGMEETQLYSFAVSQMQKIFPAAGRFVEGAARKVWDLDPWALGAYAYYRVGQFTPFYPRLATPEGRIFFAGDQTTLLPGWMEGALESGERAAAQIRQTFGKPLASAVPA